MTDLTDRQAELCERSTVDYSDLKAFFVNCTLKRSPERSRRGLDRRGRPGPSYLDDGSGGPENDFTNRNTTFATWNLLHMARMLEDAGGIPAHGNQRSEWDAGARFDFPNPEHR